MDINALIIRHQEETSLQKFDENLDSLLTKTEKEFDSEAAEVLEKGIELLISDDNLSNDTIFERLQMIPISAMITMGVFTPEGIKRFVNADPACYNLILFEEEYRNPEVDKPCQTASEALIEEEQFEKQLEDDRKFSPETQLALYHKREMERELQHEARMAEIDKKLHNEKYKVS